MKHGDARYIAIRNGMGQSSLSPRDVLEKRNLIIVLVYIEGSFLNAMLGIPFQNPCEIMYRQKDPSEKKGRKQDRIFPHENLMTGLCKKGKQFEVTIGMIDRDI